MEQLGATPAEAEKAESKLLPHMQESMTRARASGVCDPLQERLDLSEAELKKIVLGLPAVLSYSMERNVLPKLDFLQRELGLSDVALRERILISPVMIGYSLEARLQPRIELCRKMGLPAERMLFSFHSYKPADFEAACERARSKDLQTR